MSSMFRGPMPMMGNRGPGASPGQVPHQPIGVSVSPMRGPGGVPTPTIGGMPGGPAVSPLRGIGGLVMPNGGMPGMMPGGPAVSPMRQPGGMMPGQPMDPRMAIASALLGRK